MSNMGLGVLADAAVQGTLLSLQHGRQACVGQTLHNDALHQCPAIIVLDVAHPLHSQDAAQLRRVVVTRVAICHIIASRHSIAKYTATWQSMAQQGEAKHGTAWWGIAWHSIQPHSTAQHSTVTHPDKVPDASE